MKKILFPILLFSILVVSVLSVILNSSVRLEKNRAGGVMAAAKSRPVLSLETESAGRFTSEILPGNGPETAPAGDGVRFHSLISLFSIVFFVTLLFIRLRKQQYNESIQREKDMERILNGGGHGIVVIVDGIIQYANDVLLEMTGYAEREFKGAISSMLNRNLNLSSSNREVHNSDGLHGYRNYESVIYGKGGKRIYVFVTERPIRYQNQDATVLHLTKMSIIRKNGDNELNALKMRSIGNFAKGIAHDFNNFLTVILGNIELLRLENVSNQKISKYVEKIGATAMNAADLTNKYLIFSDGNFFSKRIEHIGETVRGLIVDCASRFDNDIQCHIQEGLNTIECNSDSIRYMIKDLIHNAVEAGNSENPSKISIVVSNATVNDMYQNHTPLGKYVSITIKDNGEGIPENNLSKIFDPYFSTRQRVDNKGLGLGLTAVYAIVKKHGGYISVDSIVGSGTSVQVMLPATESA